MLDSKISRRSFLKASAATGAVLTTGTVSFHAWSKTLAEGNQHDDIKVTPSLCNACSSKCGVLVITKNGRLWKMEGHPDHPFSKGKLCARGHGVATLAYSPDRLQHPLKKKEDGTFEQITWEQAYQEIGQKLNEIIKKYGPQSVGYVEDPRPTGSYYGPRFLAAIGSPNYFTHQVCCNNGRNTGYIHTIGGVPGADIKNSKYILFIGRSYGDGIRPASVYDLTTAKDNGAKIVFVDPRLNATVPLGDEWIPIRPGTDLALILAMSNVVITEKLYDEAFVQNNSIGFDEYAKAMNEYTPEWAAEITDIPQETIIRIAREIAAAKPHAMIEPGWRGANGCVYYNSTECGRAAALFNALLGNINQKGGLTFGGGAKLGDMEPVPEKSKLPRWDARFPLVSTGTGVATIIPEKAESGEAKAVIFCQTNPVRNYTDPKTMIDAMEKMELTIVCDVQMSETALAADYVLPEPSYLEREDVVAAQGAGAIIRAQAIDRVYEDTRPFDEIITNIAKEMGLGQYFNFTIQELNAARVKPLGINIDELRQKGIIFPPKPAAPAAPAEFKLKTPSGKVEFVSEAFKKAGFSPIVSWIPPKVMPDADSFRLINGKQGYHTHSYSTNLPYLMQITKDYDSERLWMNAKRAAELGLKDGDLVEVESSMAKSQVRLKVTERLYPECVFVPSPYGNYSKYLTNAVGVGFSYMDHLEFDIEPMGGHSMVQEIIVKVRKV
ncbi:molybdopterin-containing oxidoreductase family protein [Rubeoparvulum massiliense]|uniref:molybdopterin-containing oxidoreductase family protein n=1 Tax=Rubeoparvulum massiliense TaxID=1631346 RepID=UPI00065E3964|nr:molybdopterin-dependent oxidoreductase [Rubeoparvulum massiliense]